jgi:hypothetical protein
MPLLQFIHVTVAYSNAVLVAVLPHVTEYSKKLGLPIALPVIQNQVAKFHPDPIQGRVGGGLWLTNGYHFIFENGYVNSFDIITNNPWRTDDPAADWPHYIGKENMTTNDALAFARESLMKLGYDPLFLHCDVPPTSFEGPYDLREGHFPYCQIKWEKPITSEEERTNSAYVEVQVNMKDKSLLGLCTISVKLFRPNPNVDVVPELETDYRKRIQTRIYFNTNAPTILDK